MNIKQKIKKALGKNLLYEIVEQNRELEWAHIYHDSIRGRHWMENLSINVGRWAGNYSFMYVLNRVLYDAKPKDIIEFGLGESSKIISAYIENYLTGSNHDVIEHSADWLSSFKERFTLSDNSSVHILPLETKEIKGHKTESYKGIEQSVTKKYDLYLVDGPFGSKHYSRYDIVTLAESMTAQDDFIILIDDYNRRGEKETFVDLLELFKKNSIKVYSNSYSGTKSVAVIGTEKYRFVASL